MPRMRGTLAGCTNLRLEKEKGWVSFFFEGWSVVGKGRHVVDQGTLP